MGLSLAAVTAALAAGMLSFLSPCVLAALPVYSAVLTNSSKQTIKKPCWMKISCFIVGFFLVFIIAGAGISFLQQLLIKHHQTIHNIGAVFMFVMGLHFSSLLPFSIIHSSSCNQHLTQKEDSWSIFCLGIISALIWTPCNIPLIAPLLAYFSLTTSAAAGTLLFIIYALGFCIPFLLLCVVLHCYLSRFMRLQRYFQKLPRITGLLLIILSICILLGWID